MESGPPLRRWTWLQVPLLIGLVILVGTDNEERGDGVDADVEVGEALHELEPPHELERCSWRSRSRGPTQYLVQAVGEVDGRRHRQSCMLQAYAWPPPHRRLVSLPSAAGARQ